MLARMLLPDTISTIAIRPVGCDALLLCNLPTSTVRISFAHGLRFFPYPPTIRKLLSLKPPARPSTRVCDTFFDAFPTNSGSPLMRMTNRQNLTAMLECCNPVVQFFPQRSSATLQFQLLIRPPRHATPCPLAPTRQRKHEPSSARP